MVTTLKKRREPGANMAIRPADDDVDEDDEDVGLNVLGCRPAGLIASRIYRLVLRSGSLYAV